MKFGDNVETELVLIILEQILTFVRKFIFVIFFFFFWGGGGRKKIGFYAKTVHKNVRNFLSTICFSLKFGDYIVCVQK